MVLRRILSIILLLGALAHSSPGGERSPSPYYQIPSDSPEDFRPEVQTDDFSCGFHALSAVYRSYGLVPERARLRERLGTSVPAIPFVSDSTGTLQPDLFRVLQQDGFETEVVYPGRSNRDRALLIDHLEGEHYALALVQTERAGGLHWVVFTDYRNGQVVVGDSLRSGLQVDKLASLVRGPLLSAILLEPSLPSPGSPYYRAQANGLGVMVMTLWEGLPLWGNLLILVVLVSLGWLLVRTCWRIGRKLRKRLRSTLTNWKRRLAAPDRWDPQTESDDPW